MRILSAAHDQASSDTQKIYEYIAVPTIIIPLIMAPVEAMGHKEYWMTYVTMLAFITTGVLSGVNVFFKFKEKSINHASASENLKDIINNIDMEFAKRSNERIQATVLMQTVRLKVNQIGLEAPPVPVAPFIQSELGYKGAKNKPTYRKHAPCDAICADAAIQECASYQDSPREDFQDIRDDILHDEESQSDYSTKSEEDYKKEEHATLKRGIKHPFNPFRWIVHFS